MPLQQTNQVKKGGLEALELNLLQPHWPTWGMDTGWTVIAGLKLGKASDLDGVTAEHIMTANHMHILNAPLDLEGSFEARVIMAVYKGGGKDAILVDNY